jgi:hypothetical protein
VLSPWIPNRSLLLRTLTHMGTVRESLYPETGIIQRFLGHLIRGIVCPYKGDFLESICSPIKEEGLLGKSPFWMLAVLFFSF